jgi:hypothetical protein
MMKTEKERKEADELVSRHASKAGSLQKQAYRHFAVDATLQVRASVKQA